MNRLLAGFFASLMLPSAAWAQTADEAAFRALYKEMVETNTTFSVGNCTLLADKIAARFKAAGFPDHALVPFSTPEWPRSGGLIVNYPGSDKNAKPMLLLAHLDVVEAKREDWTRDPFTLVEEGGYFYGRGTHDDKSQVAIWVDSLIRYRQEGFKPRRTIKLALTCGEESSVPFNGASWLMANRRELMDAEFALNEGAWGQLDEQGNRVALLVEAGEKTSQNFSLEVTNIGGHSSVPLPDNAIYHLADAIRAIKAHEFPVQINDANRAYLTRMAKITGGEQGAAMAGLANNPMDTRAAALLSRTPTLNAMLRTTCVATQITAGHAPNALPQRATATVNCRIFPGVSRDAVRQTLIDLIKDPAVIVTRLKVARTESDDPPPPLTQKIMGPIEKVAGEIWPGVPVVPVLQAAATDGRALLAGGIPTYGVSGLFFQADLGNIHGLNERVGVTSLFEGREFLYRLVKLYANQRN